MESDNQKRKRTIYSTAVINQLIADYQQGYDIDYSPFFMRDLDLRAANIPFKMTEEEMKEYQKCFDNPLYYAENYAKFLTDHGLSTVELRDFQKNVISTVTDEYYDEESELLLPTNRNLIWMAARQSGKCQFFGSKIYVCDKGNNAGHKILIGEYYDKVNDKRNSFRKQTFCKCKNLLYKCYLHVTSRFIKNFLGRLIEKIESIEYKGYSFDERDIYKKIINSVSLKNTKVLADTGYEIASAIHLTQPYTVYEIKTENGKKIECADTHIVYNENFQEKFVSDLKLGDFILTKDGPEKVVYIYKCPYKFMMYDITVDSDNHRFYSNDILSHNTTTIAAFLSWMIVFHIDRNILIVANKEKTAIEIVDKIINIFKGLPFWLKPGCEAFGKTAIKLDNGSKIISSATTNTASIGFTIHCVLLDEFAHIPDNIVNNFWRSVYPTLSSSKVSQCIITSTPNGVTNKFYEIWDKAINKQNSFIPIRTDYWEVPGHDAEWAQKQKADFGEEEFAQEFELQFNKNSKMLMKADDVKFMEKFTKDYVQKKVFVQNSYANNEYISWHPDFDPNDIKDTDKFVFLVDLAEGNGNQDEKQQSKKKTPDANTINIFKLVLNSPANIRRYSTISCNTSDCIKLIQIGKYKCSSEDEIMTARVCSALAYNVFKDHERDSVRVIVEMNFNGKSFLEEFKRHQMFTDSTILKTYHTKPVPGEKRKKLFGIKTTTNKEHFCIKGNKLLNMKRTIITDIETLEQMKSFGYVRNKLGGIACHDDLSMPVFNHIPRALCESAFTSWIDEYMYFSADRSKVFVINQIIQKWAMDNPDMSDDEFDSLYGTDNVTPFTNETSVDFGNITFGYDGYNMGYNTSDNMTYSQLLNRR